MEIFELFESIYIDSLKKSLSEDLKEIKESLYDALFIATHFTEVCEDESVKAKTDRAINQSLASAESRLQGFKQNLKHNKAIAKLISQEFVYDFEKSLKSICEVIDGILKTNYAHKRTILRSLSEICSKTNKVIKDMIESISRFDVLSLLKLKNLDGSPFYGSFENLKEFNDRLLGGKYAKVRNLKVA